MRNVLPEIQSGDLVIAQLPGSRVGRIGEVIRMEVEDKYWKPLVPKSKHDPYGEMGRRILVRWDLAHGPLDHNLIIELPHDARFTSGLRRSPISELSKRQFNKIAKAAKDKKNWGPYAPHVFSEEKSISDFLAANPQSLEDGLKPYPSMRVREHVFGGRSRADVLLIDLKGRPVIVECKQGAPRPENLRQLRKYMRIAGRVIGKKPRGILVHGGSVRLAPDVLKEKRLQPKVDFVRYKIYVNFDLME